MRPQTYFRCCAQHTIHDWRFCQQQMSMFGLKVREVPTGRTWKEMCLRNREKIANLYSTREFWWWSRPIRRCTFSFYKDSLQLVKINGYQTQKRCRNHFQLSKDLKIKKIVESIFSPYICRLIWINEIDLRVLWFENYLHI